MKRAVLIATAALAACSDQYTVVTVDARPAVTGAATILVNLANGDSSAKQEFELDSRTFPVTFSIATPGRSGELDLAATAFGSGGSAAGPVLALGSASVDIDTPAIEVMLDPVDFVVNTTYPDDQFLTTDFETKGYQVAAIDGGTWTVAFRDDCASCQIYGRMFDENGIPIKTTTAASTDQFTLTTAVTDDNTFPAVAAAGAATIAVWDFTDPTTMARGIACRSIDSMGGLSASQLTLSTDSTADAVTVAPLSNGQFAVAWQVTPPAAAIRTAVVMPDCTTTGVVTASTTVGATDGPHRAGIANNGDSVLYTWLTDSAVHVRAGTTTGTFTGADTLLFSSPPMFQIQQARVSPMGAGFAIAIRLATPDGVSAGMIELLRTNAAGQLIQGAPTVISAVTGADFSVGSQGFSNVTRTTDNATLIAWQQCADGGAGACSGSQDIYGRLVRPTGAPVGDAFMIPTTTSNDQGSPAAAALGSAFAVAWNDSSSTAPDTSGTAVRARVIYPDYDDATKVLSAVCKTTADCEMGLACAMHSDGQARCSATCTPPTCTDGGTCSPALDPTVNACVF